MELIEPVLNAHLTLNHVNNPKGLARRRAGTHGRHSDRSALRRPDRLELKGDRNTASKWKRTRERSDLPGKSVGFRADGF